MAVKAQRFQARNPVVDKEGRPTAEFLRNLNSAIDIINAVAAAQSAANAAQVAANTAQAAAESAQIAAENAGDGADVARKEQSIVNSYPANYTGPLLSADAAGTLTIAAHQRVYGDPALNPTVNVNAAILSTAYTPEQVVRVYYDDPMRAGGAVTYVATTDIVGQMGNRHVIGAVAIPATGNDDGRPLYPPGYVIP